MASYDALGSTTNLNDIRSPYNPRYNESTGYITPAVPNKKRTSSWIKFGIPAVLLVIVAAVVAVVLVLRHKNSSSSSSSSVHDANSPDSAVDAGIFATATNSFYMIPIYPSSTNTALYTSPTFNAATDLAWPADTFAPSSPSATSVRPDRPRLIAPAYKWAALPARIAADPYLASWNATIFGNATTYYSLDPVVYFMDGSSGILDNSRAVKERIKAFAYAYRMSNDTKWVDRCWTELQNAAGNGTQSFGPDVDRWNSLHFLDTAEMSAAFGIAYDWLYDIWTEDQKSQILFSLLEYGLTPGLEAFSNGTTGWWSNNGTYGNWNCVCNSGLTMASLAVLGDDTTNTAEQLLALTLPNANENCAMAVDADGTWGETANYWYFGTTGHAEMTSSLMTATGSDYGLSTVNPSFPLTGEYHMYASSLSLFNWGDHGPNKYSTTANAMFLYSTLFNKPEYALFQRDRYDAAEPCAMFWYDITVQGAWWDNKPLDSFFNTEFYQWAAMRGSWTDNNALYVGMKAGLIQGHQTHNDIDIGDFVLDAMGTRWAGELGSGDYNSPGYFLSDDQNAQRWMYYRKMTEGQNTIVINESNQLVTAVPVIVSEGSSNTTQGSSTVLDVTSDSKAFWVVDMSTAYANATSVVRGVRTLNARKQVLIQDEITAQAGIQWRMHTNATVTLNGSSASLALDGQTMTVQILSPSTATFSTTDAVRYPSDPTPPEPDQPNPGVTVLMIALDAGTYNLQVLFNPTWSPTVTMVTPPSVDLADWTLDSHDSSS